MQDTLYILRTTGWPAAVRSLTRRIGQLFFSTVEFAVLARSLDEPIGCSEPRASVEVRQGIPQDMPRIGNLVSPSYRKRHEQLFARDDSICFVATHEQEIVAWCWVSKEFVHRAPLQLALTEGYVHGVYTVPGYRRLGIQAVLLAHCAAWAHEQGHRRLIALVNVGNGASRGMFSKAGYRQIGQLNRSHILWWYRFRQKPTDNAVSSGSTGD